MRLSLAVKIVAAVAVAVTVALIAATKAIDFERYKGYIADLVEAETGRKLTFGGPVKLRLGLVPSLIADNITLSNPAGGAPGPMIRIQRVEAEVALPALLRKEILIQRLIVSSPEIILENGNWNLDSGRADKQASGTPTRFDLRELKIKNAKVSWRGTDGRQTLVAVHKLVLLPEQGAGTGLGVNVVGDSQGRTFEFTGKVGNLGAALAGKPWPVSLKGAGTGTIVSVDGTIGTLNSFTGLDFKVSFQTDELSDFLYMAGYGNGRGNGLLGPMRLAARLHDTGGVLALDDMDVSAGKRDFMFVSLKGAVKNVVALAGIDVVVQAETENLAHLDRVLNGELPTLGPVRVSAALRDAKGAWLASDIKAHVGGSDLAGEAGLHAGGRLTANLTSAHLDVADFVGKSAPAPADGRVIPALALPLESLRGQDVDLALRAEKLVLSGLALSGAAMEARLKGGVLSVPVLKGGLAGGTVNGAMTVDARPAQPLADLRLDLAEVDFGKLNREAGSDLLTGGVGGLKLALKSRGGDLRTLAANANGSAVLSLGPGRVHNRAFSLAGGDLISVILSALNPLAQSRETTEMACAVAHFRLKDGVAVTDKGLAVQADGIDVVGAGTIDLRNEALDLGFTPRAKEGLGLSLGGQMSGLTRLRGTLAAPSLSVDEMGAARAALSVGAATATAGLSLLGELLLDKVMADTNPCRTALAMGSHPSEAGGKGGGFLEGLFGR
ncbi:putative outer membrane biogenesis protein [Magnetospirillum gryphiswaldense MSR-1 v2]|uniref:Outer membrane biogenesis protein n=1 Tax=Magnetospirillum gryphiswaldense (strain DSM 6361 / JCM 21280 / NBRC 15271 / MSR-1) TaxID=431944 RepID=V6F4I9_MAGGM|nr:AsmA family protein [Magnetospirillum gryphiswaldense]CDL00369.1 putative outer membrane biogenesis protein [Magnetospirillum gryphiswaldense MSR-1 v2]